MTACEKRESMSSSAPTLSECAPTRPALQERAGSLTTRDLPAVRPGCRDFWVFYGQYALLRDLLFNRDYRPAGSRRLGGVPHLRASATRPTTAQQTQPSASTAPGAQPPSRRYSGSTFDRNGGFKDSKYASKSGSYRDSEFATPAARNPNVDRNPQRFGSGSKPRVAPLPAPPRTHAAEHSTAVRTAVVANIGGLPHLSSLFSSAE